MTLLPLVAAYSFLLVTPQAATSGGTPVQGGGAAALKFDAPKTGVDPAVGGFAGFRYAEVDKREWPAPYALGYDLSKFEYPTVDGKALKLPLNLVIFERTSLYRDTPGPGRDVLRGSFETNSRNRLILGLGRLAGLVAAWSKGKIILDPAIRFERDPVSLDNAEQDLRRYFQSHTNQGTFEAEDGIFRGPFAANIALVAGPGVSLPISPIFDDRPTLGRFSAMTVGVAGIEQGGAVLELELFRRIYEQLALRLGDVGIEGIKKDLASTGLPLAALGQLVGEGDEAIVLGKAEPDGATLERLNSENRGGGPTLREPEGSVFGTVLPPFELAVEKDAEKGDVLTVIEKSMFRDGGFALPKPAGGFPLLKEMPSHLSFEVKTFVRDAFAVRFRTTSGRNVDFEVGAIASPFNWETLAADGKWRKVYIPLGEVAKAGDRLERIEIVAAPSQRFAGKADLGALSWAFSDFKFEDSKVERAANPVLSRLAQLAAIPDKDPKLAEFLKNDEPIQVVYQALRKLEGANLKSIPADLDRLTKEIVPPIAEAAIRCVGSMDGEVATALLRGLIRTAPIEHGRLIAVEELVKRQNREVRKDVSLINDFGGLVGRQNVRLRATATRSLGVFQSERANRFRVTFSIQDDPEVRLAAIEAADADDIEFAQKKLLFLSINDPSDQVRFTGYKRLLGSKEAKIRAEGAKGIKDDSVGVRVRVVAEIPTALSAEEARPVLQSAVVDLSPSVRAEAALALGKLGNIDPGEVQNLFGDKHPFVIKALISLVREKKLTVSAQVIEAWGKNPAPSVKTALQGLRDGAR